MITPLYQQLRLARRQRPVFFAWVLIAELWRGMWED
jgi:hypothetical protein